jgi:protein-tyrosine-phosphatase
MRFVRAAGIARSCAVAAIAASWLAMPCALPATAAEPAGTDAIVTFVCEHGAAKSVLAAALFNRLALEHGAHVHAIARGTSPAPRLQPETVAGLQGDGMQVEQAPPRLVTPEDVRDSSVVVTIDVPDEPAYLRTTKLREWNGVPAVSEGYAAARDDLQRRVQRLLVELTHGS